MGRVAFFLIIQYTVCTECIYSHIFALKTESGKTKPENYDKWSANTGIKLFRT